MAHFIHRLKISACTALFLAIRLSTDAAAQTATPSPNPTATSTAPTSSTAIVVQVSDPLGGLFTWIMGGGLRLVLFGAILALGAIALRMAASGAFGNSRDLSQHWFAITHVVIGVFVFVSASMFIFGLASVLSPFWKPNLMIPQSYCTGGVVC